VEGVEAYGITWPLLTTAGGLKMGKTAAGAVWLDPEMTSPYEFYQYWINVDDRDVERFLAYYTFLPLSEVKKLGALQGAEIREAKEVLAYEATKISHGEAEAEKARQASRAAFEGRAEDPSAIPSTTVGVDRLKEGILVVDVLAEVGLASSKSAARRLIQQGGAYVNQDRIDDIEAKIDLEDFQNGDVMLRAGKKRYHRLVVGSKG